jgi:hypothetical protein
LKKFVGVKHAIEEMIEGSSLNKIWIVAITAFARIYADKVTSPAILLQRFFQDIFMLKYAKTLQKVSLLNDVRVFALINH